MSSHADVNVLGYVAPMAVVAVQMNYPNPNRLSPSRTCPGHLSRPGHLSASSPFYQNSSLSARKMEQNICFTRCSFEFVRTDGEFRDQRL
jgi:hypothetical protein